jgi:thymidylate synthase
LPFCSKFRHIDAAIEILNRKSINISPRIELNVNKNFYDINIDDFKIYDVKDIPKIESPLELAI